jgi:hypothetical protein
MWPKAKGLLLKETKKQAGWSAIAEDANWCVRLAGEQSINAESVRLVVFRRVPVSLYLRVALNLPFTTYNK